MIGRTWTNPKVGGKGYSPALIDGLGKIGYRILSDRQLSKNAFKVWNKLSQKRNIKGFDWSTKQYTSEDPTNNPNISFVLEYEVCFYRSSILNDSYYWIKLKENKND